MARHIQSLESMGLDFSPLSGTPQLSALVDKRALQAKLAELQERCPGVDLSPHSANVNLRWLAGLPLQLQRLDNNYNDTIQKWRMRERDINALKFYYEMVLRLEKIAKVCTSLTCSVFIYFRSD